MKYLNSGLKYLTVKDFPQGGSSLFGKDFGSKAKAAVEDIKALKRVQSNKSRFFWLWWPQKKDKVYVPRSLIQLGHHTTHKQVCVSQAGKIAVCKTSRTQQQYKQPFKSTPKQ